MGNPVFWPPRGGGHVKVRVSLDGQYQGGNYLWDSATSKQALTESLQAGLLTSSHVSGVPGRGFHKRFLPPSRSLVCDWKQSERSLSRSLTIGCRDNRTLVTTSIYRISPHPTWFGRLSGERRQAVRVYTPEPGRLVSTLRRHIARPTHQDSRPSSTAGSPLWLLTLSRPCRDGGYSDHLESCSTSISGMAFSPVPPESRPM